MFLHTHLSRARRHASAFCHIHAGHAKADTSCTVAMNSAYRLISLDSLLLAFLLVAVLHTVALLSENGDRLMLAIIIVLQIKS